MVFYRFSVYKDIADYLRANVTDDLKKNILTLSLKFWSIVCICVVDRLKTVEMQYILVTDLYMYANHSDLFC